MNIIKGIVVTFFFVNFSNVYALQEVDVKDGVTVSVKLSARELTRIAIKGAGRINKAWAAGGAFDIQPDKDSGEIFVRPLRAGAVSLFVRDDNGGIYTLVGIPHDIPSETVLLKTGFSQGKKRQTSIQGSRHFATPLVSNTKKLLTAMALFQPIPEYDLIQMDEIIPVWKEVYIRYKQTYEGYELSGDTYLVKNITTEELRFDEKEFLEFGQSIIAVALEKHILNPGEETYLFVVRNTVSGDNNG